jgi:hypothetical protein
MMIRKRTLRSLLLVLLSIFSGGQTMAQTDITKYYLNNYGFDTDFDYPATSTATVEQEILDIPGWTSAITVDYTITGIYEFGFQGKFNNGSVPAQGYDGEAGGALALSTGWEQNFSYYQTVTLPAGTYTLIAPTYNGKSATGGTSLLAWIPSSGTSVTSTVKSYLAKKWTLDQITFTLSKQTTGKLQIGYKAAAGGSANSANLLIDYVKLMGENMTVNKTALYSNLTAANRLYGEGTGIGADALKNAIDAAQTVYDNAEATMPEVLEANFNLTEAMESYKQQNASEDNPVDRTALITNPSFEKNGTDGWTVSNMSTQNNSVFSKKKGTYYLESWVNIGQQIGSASVLQTVKGLPQGNYRLKASALHIQQSGSQSTTNKGNDQKGAAIVAGTSSTAVTAMKEYTVAFAVLDEKQDVEIGLVATNATGNYLCVDNFILQYVGDINDDSYVIEIVNLLEKAEQLLALGLQNTVAEQLRQVVCMAENAIATPTDGSTPVYDRQQLVGARTKLITALDAAYASRQLYDNLQQRIDYALTVIEWWKDTERKATALANLTVAIETARQQITDYSLTDAQLKSAVTALNNKIAAVDKKIYCSTSACGTDADLKKSTSQWCYDRSLQSKHWILFWEAGYGTSVPAAVPGILQNADKIFEFYADSLKFITINQGKSKTDTYKMIIRLRHTTDWEASGSGIDNQIGLLTLSNGAHTSRSGQTVAHEIGHCFQYQTHCDNNDWNGWMYNWGNSTLNVFWEMCAQWQAYKFYPKMQFVWDSGQGNDWFGGTINGLHRHPLCVDLRYNNYFIQDYMCHKHGMDFLGRLWNESRSPEDPLQAYMRLTMTGTAAEKLNQLNEEMWEYGARMTTFDMDPIRDNGKSRIGFRDQTALVSAGDGFWRPTAANCIENFGNNAIRLNVPTTDKTVYAELVGQAGRAGYTTYNKTKAGWKFGFVALQKDGTRLYSDIGTATYKDSVAIVAFDCPKNCSYVWLVVSGAPTSYWTRDWLSWSEESTAEQWPYRVKLYQTNVFGKANNDTLPDGIDEITVASARQASPADAVYSATGQLLRRGTTSLDGLPRGIYIVGGKKVWVK